MPLVLFVFVKFSRGGSERNSQVSVVIIPVLLAGVCHMVCEEFPFEITISVQDFHHS